jgi:ubiquinone/menaquinone biosynthesis C-methylase UbiE
MLQKLSLAGLLTMLALRAQQQLTEEELTKLTVHMDKALGLHAGMNVADIGTGLAVQHPMRMAREVSPGGKVVCVEVTQFSVDRIQKQIDDGHVANMTAVLGKENDPMLEPGTFDAMLLSNTYHEFTQPKAMLKHICEALKPGGTLVVVENYSLAHRGDSRAEQAKRHDMAPETLERELAAAGFTVKERIEPVLVNSPDRLRYLVRAEKTKYR